MFLDAMDSLGLYAKGIYEPLETSIVEHLVTPGDVVLDIGAHIGYYTLLFSSLVGESGKVFAFEPDQANFRVLEKNVAINRLSNVTLVQNAVSNLNGIAQLYVSRSNSGDHQMYRSDSERPAVDVASLQLDSYFDNEVHDISFIKMDIQGSEWAALRGMERLVGRLPRLRIMTEFWPSGLVRAGADPAEFLAWFSRNGFRLYEIGRRRRKLEEASISYLLSTLTPHRGNFANLLCVKDQPD
jgi:FkbM family methyltransferase